MNNKLLAFDDCSKEHKAKGGDKGDRKAHADKVVSETISEKLISQKRPKAHEGAIKRSGKLIGPRIGKSKGSERLASVAVRSVYLGFVCLAFGFLIYFLEGL